MVENCPGRGQAAPVIKLIFQTAKLKWWRGERMVPSYRNGNYMIKGV
jgi:hypothetical protein